MGRGRDWDTIARTETAHDRTGRQPRRNALALGAAARTRSRSRHRGGPAPGAADQARGLARPARGIGDLARDLAGAPPAAARPSAHDRLRRQSRRGGARRFGLPRLGDGADGAELHRRGCGGQPAVPGRRRRFAGLRDEPRGADRRHRRGAGNDRRGMRAGDGLRHDGGRARHRRVGGGRDGDRQHHRRRRPQRGTVRRRRLRVDRPRHRRRRGGARREAPRRGAGGGAAPPGGARPARPAAPARRA